MPASHFPTHSTPFPSHLLDAVMPLLRDTEWRLLCVVVRQTLGWQELTNGDFDSNSNTVSRTGRKERDWLTHSQLMVKTGRSGEAVSHAMDVLVRRGLIEALDEDGEALTTPQERQRHAGRLYFRLAPAALTEPDQVQQSLSTQESEKHEGERNLRSGVSEQKIEVSITKSEEATSEIENAPRESEVLAPKSEVSLSESEVGKAKTTKETENKRKVERATSETAFAPGVVGNSEDKAFILPQTVSSSPISDSMVSLDDQEAIHFLRLYRDQFRQRSAQSDPPPLSWSKEGALVRRLLLTYGLERLEQLLDAFFDSDDAWARKCGYSLVAFQHLLPSLLMGEKRRRLWREDATALVMHGPSAVWLQASEGQDKTVAPRASLFEQHPDLARRVRGQPP